ncbi:MAG: hypothetical protein OXG76_13635 [Acidimicrobiaceae bacterium]|nr:hypothetical protein [Acidimicrobiaceae bacterium]
MALQIVTKIFGDRYKPGMAAVPFHRSAIAETARALGANPPRNLGDVVYNLRYRTPLPAEVNRHAPSGYEWAIFPGGMSVYVMRPVRINWIEPRPGMRIVKLPDSTPGVISRYSMSDEQALLARVRYNRLLDVFTGLACHALQSHLRTSITIDNAITGKPSSSQVETDELYVGLDEHGAHYVLPVQAKGGSDALSVIQIWQDYRVAEQKFPTLRPRPIAAQFMNEDEIALFEFHESHDGITIARERHYQLVPPDQLSEEELRSYRAESEADAT